jgi:DNA modification methylase
MKPHTADADFTLYQGDALEVLRELPEASVHCAVTSPPYWALRDYDVAGQIGLERTPAEYVARLVEVFAAVARVLCDDGTLWLVLGDSYAAKARGSDLGWDKSRLTNPGTQQKAQAASMRRTGERHRGQEAGLKNKDLCMIPARVALALQADGWYLRSQIVWSKSNPMPESVTDRPTTSHEFVFLLTKQPRYYFDQDAVREPFGPHGPTPWGKNERERDRGGRTDGFTSGTGTGWTPAGYEPPRPQDETLDGSDGEAQRGPDGRRVTGRNLRSVWEIPTQPTSEAHFATYPEELVRRCILAGCPGGGHVLDPFGGSGTTALVARQHGRRSILIELNSDYCALAARRLSQQSLLTEATA